MDKSIEIIKNKLLDSPQEISDISALKPDLDPKIPAKNPPVAAAILIALVRQKHGYDILYTKRATSLRAHSGQIAFPGGKIDLSDKDAASAAIREANEEVAMKAQDVSILGYLPAMFTGTNYLITPVVGVVEPSAPFIANPEEVDEVFQVPLTFLSRDDAYQSFKVWHENKYQQTWKIEHDGRVIWGITASLTRAFKDIALVGYSHD
jgi:8-oxo-dGTP pyrophosphatase MutT (NUDIX family)